MRPKVREPRLHDIVVACICRSALLYMSYEQVPFCFEEDEDPGKGNYSSAEEKRTVLVWRKRKRQTLYQQAVEFGVLFPTGDIDSASQGGTRSHGHV